MGMEQLQVRKGEPADAGMVATLLEQLGYAAPDDDIADRLRWFSRSGADHVLVATSGTHAVGLVAMSVVPRFAEGGRFARITALLVPSGPDQPWIRRALIGEVESVARRHGCTGVEVVEEFQPGDDDSHHQFDELGYDRADVHEIRSQKPLDPPDPIRI